jgi:hypothetical protein
MTDEPTQIIQPVHDSHDDSSLLSALRARRDEHAAEQTYDAEVPGYSGQVALRLRALTAREQSRISNRLTTSRAPDKEALANMDTLVIACTEIVVRDDYDEPWQSLGALDGGEPIAIDERLVDVLKLTPEADTARETLRSLFGLAPSPDIAINGVVNDYLEWLRGANDEVDREFVGESHGGTTSK